MRLLNIETRRLEHVSEEKSKRYAILSHTWEGQEPTYQDFCADPAAVLRTPKVQGLIQLAITESRPIHYVWIDTICIDKTSSAELQEAINSMYKWYQNSTLCYAYLKDVDTDTHMEGAAFYDAIRKSRWFTRGWTLQELLAPRLIFFHDRTWCRIGEKFMVDPSDRGKPVKLSAKNLVPVIHEATGIPVAVLEGRQRIQSCSVAQRMSWASLRHTTREEDRAYSLMGLFGVNMPMLYGEGEGAFLRLQDEIMKRTDDHSLFAYNYHRQPTFKSTDFSNNLRPLTPADYQGCAYVTRLRSFALYNDPDLIPHARDGSYTRTSSVSGASPVPDPSGSSTPKQLLSPPLSSSSQLTTPPPRWSGGSIGGSSAFGSTPGDCGSRGYGGGGGGGLVFNNNMEHYVMTNKGLHIELDILEVPKLPGTLVGRLNCIVKDAADSRPEDRVVVIPLYQLPTLPGSKLVLRTLGASLVDLPLWLFDARNTTTRQLYITNDPFDAETHRGSKSLLEFVSIGHPFMVSEMYPPVLSFSHFRNDFRNHKGWPMRFTYAAEDLPRRMYIRFRSEERNLGFLVKMKLEYDAWNEPSRATCSVSAMPKDKSLLELLLLDEYPAPHGKPQTIPSSFEYINRIEYRQQLRYRSNINVDVKVALLLGNCIRLTLTTQDKSSDNPGESEREAQEHQELEKSGSNWEEHKRECSE